MKIRDMSVKKPHLTVKIPWNSWNLHAVIWTWFEQIWITVFVVNLAAFGKLSETACVGPCRFKIYHSHWWSSIGTNYQWFKRPWSLARLKRSVSWHVFLALGLKKLGLLSDCSTVVCPLYTKYLGHSLPTNCVLYWFMYISLSLWYQ